MPALRELLEGAGLGDVQTYMQSGNAVVSSTARPDEVARECEKLIADAFGLDLRVLVRSRAELARIVRRDPLGEVATEPKRYQVTFLEAPLPAETIATLEAAVAGDARFLPHP